jgi:Tn3 transposase DDE domain
VHTGLNKGDARNALARAVFFYRLGEIRDRSFEQQQYRFSGLALVTVAIELWNMVYLERATNALRANGQAFDPALRQHLSPLGWEHINLTGDYLWRNTKKISAKASSGLCGRFNVRDSPLSERTPLMLSCWAGGGSFCVSIGEFGLRFGSS